jgi:prepilin-type N-terminal cleavage/methylation domain-containing protein
MLKRLNKRFFGMQYKTSGQSLTVNSGAIEDEGQLAYSLIEVLITIVIMGTILIIVNAVLISLIRVSYDTDVRMGIRQEVEFALEVMQRDIKSADPVTLDNTGGLEMNLSGSGEPVVFQERTTVEGVTYLCVMWPKRGGSGRSVYLTSPEMTDIEEFDITLHRNDFSGTVEVLVTIKADSVQKRVNGDPVVDDIYKQISIISRGQEI